MNYLVSSSDGVTNCGDPIEAIRSPFGVLAESIRLEAEHDAITDGEDPNSPAVKLDVANRIASERLSLFIESSNQTQGQVAAQLGVSRGHLNRVLNLKAPLDYKSYQRLFELEQIVSILGWIERTKTPAEQEHFEALFSGVRIFDPYARTLYVLAAVFGEGALQDWQDSTGSILPIPAESESPEALQAALRKAAV